MSRIVTITEIRAPIERVFDLSRSVDLHVRSASETGETAVAGVTSGLLELDQEVTWRGRHFGVWRQLTSRITAFSRPDYFRDSMVRGDFLELNHDHFFSDQGNKTIMKDVFDFTAPFGFLGDAADRFFLRPHLKQFILARNRVIKKTAESDDWKSYLGNGSIP
jgi:ligand-binding SRPBCC domain-containing protein